MLWLRALLFFVVAPGTVLGFVPYRILRRERPFDVAVDPATALRWLVGALLVSTGLAGLVWCFALFVRRGRGTPAPYDPPRALVTAGPYAVSRNPMYVCLWLVLAGEVAATGSGSLAAWALAVVAANVLFVRLYEEPTLARLFGREYEAYRARVPRWLGWRRRVS